MALSPDFRWKVPEFSGTSAQANSMAQGLNSLVTGLGSAIKGYRNELKEKAIRDLAQENWQRQFDSSEAARTQQQENWAKQFAANEAARKQQQENWQKQFGQTTAMQNAQLNQMRQQLLRQQEQDAWLRAFYDKYFAEDPEEQEYNELRERLFGNQPSDTNGASLVMSGLNPQLMK